MTLIDAHQHLWQPSRGDYRWMPDNDPILTRPYGPDDLRAELAATGVAKTVLVQAAATVAETEYMLGLADATDEIAGVVGWVDFEQPGDRAQLERFAAHPKFRGVRPMIQDINDDNWMLRPYVQWGYQAAVDLDLSFDALGYPRHLANFLTIFTRHPDLRVVVDHCMKPQIAEHSDENFSFWAEGMTRIASETGAFCKLSGLVTEAPEKWTVDQLRPYADHVLDVFGPARVMWGSDWPVCRLRAEYGNWFATAQKLTANLSKDDRARVFGATAAEFYRIDQ